MCGEINYRYGVQLVEVFYYVIDYVNSREDIFLRVIFGGIVLDVCESFERVGNFVVNIYSKNFELKNNGFVLDFVRFDVYIGIIESEFLICIVDVLNFLSIL